MATFAYAAARDYGLIVLKNSTPQNSLQNFGKTFLRFCPQETRFEKAGFSGKTFSEFGPLGPHTEFFNTIGSLLPSEAVQQFMVCHLGQRRVVVLGGRGGSEDLSWKHQTYLPFEHFALHGTKAASLDKSDH